ncbi:MAG: hypothetical protein ACPLKS_07500 [Caldisericum exile]|uniref:hypothetical protein n=1 Tax=Caldisericum exile TaxID=693075 RepID=UPI003C7802A3
MSEGTLKEIMQEFIEKLEELDIKWTKIMEDLIDEFQYLRFAITRLNNFLEEQEKKKVNK